MNAKIYVGEVTHSRLTPTRHSFRYPIYFYAFSVDDLSTLAVDLPLFGYNQLRPVAIHDRDYLVAGDLPMRKKLEKILSDAGKEEPLGKIILVTAARFFNYIFNPISFFYCHDPDDQLVYVLAQVRNTFGEMHLYLLDYQEAVVADGRLRFKADKQFHVSPFFPRRGYYEFRLTEAGDRPHSRHRDSDDQRESGENHRRPSDLCQPDYASNSLAGGQAALAKETSRVRKARPEQPHDGSSCPRDVCRSNRHEDDC